jgi:hypothetical protein
MSTYDPHELKIIRRGVSIEKVIAAYKHFGSLRKAAHVCAISKDTVSEVLTRYHVQRPSASLPAKASYNPKNLYSDFAKWHKAHAEDLSLPRSRIELAKLSGVNVNVVKCYFYRRRKAARKILSSLPDLRKLDLVLQDIEGHRFHSGDLVSYRYVIDRYSQRAALQGELENLGEVTVLIPSIDQFAARVRKLTSSAVSSQASPKHPST